MRIEKYSSKEHWEAFWEESKPKEGFIPPYHALFERHLKKNRKWTCFEIGCVPGNYLMYFHQNYGYQPAGIDYSEKIKAVRKYFAGQRIPVELYNDDFFKFKPVKKYNVVYSIGFVEHFGDPEKVFKRHVDLLATNGFLIISMPNFRNLQYYLHKIFDAETLKTHNFEVMHPELWKRLAEKHSLKILYCDYFETFDYWVVNRKLWLRPFTGAAKFAAKMVRFILRNTGTLYIPNRYTSPHILLIAKRM